jgi:hypothetical protein
MTEYESINVAIEKGIILESELKEEETLLISEKNTPPNIRKSKPRIYDDEVSLCYSIIDGGKLYFNFRKPLVFKNVSKTIDLRFARLTDIQKRKREFYDFTAAAKAKYDSDLFLLSKSVLADDKLFFNYFNIEDVDVRIIYYFLSAFLQYMNYIPSHIYRAIARGHGQSGKIWRRRWSAWDRKHIDCNIFMEELIYWTQLYDSVFDAYEKPDEIVIEDDDSLDMWLYKQKMERKRKNKGGEHSKYVDNIDRPMSLIRQGNAKVGGQIGQ